jgi:hypothetical protein
MARTRKSPSPDTEPAPQPAATSSLRPWLVQLVFPLLGGALLLGLVLVAGRYAREQLRARGHTTANFADIDCVPPPGLSREEFLGQVQYLSNFPDQFDLLDEGACERLHRAFAAHPWAQEVTRVEKVTPGRVRAELVYRTPVLAVPIRGGSRRAVDRHAVLLPAAAAAADLPLFGGTVEPPSGRPGSPWGDGRVEAGARTLGEVGPHLDRLGLRPCTVAVTDGEVVLSGPRVRIVWGRPPGQEGANEASAPTKVQRLLEWRGNEVDVELDVRPAAAMRRTALR